MPMKQEAERAAEFWSSIDCSASERNFYAFPPIRSRSCKLIFGQADSRADWCEYWTVEKYLKERVPFDSALSLCCGFGELERILARLNVFRQMIGLDIAPGAIEQAKSRARSDGFTNIDYKVCDINVEDLPAQAYDLIWANGALHHIRDLERVIPMLYRALKPNGILISNEYVGPRYQRIGERQQEVINAVVHLLPSPFREPLTSEKSWIERLKARALANERAGPFGQVWRHTPMSYFTDVDPSECVASDRIVPILTETFDSIDVRYFGGSILFYALGANFYNEFDLTNERHKKLLEMLFQIEDALVSAGEIPNDNAHIVCWKK